MGSGGRCAGGVGSFLAVGLLGTGGGRPDVEMVDVAEAVELRLGRRAFGALGTGGRSPDGVLLLPAVTLLLADTADALDAVDVVR